MLLEAVAEEDEDDHHPEGVDAVDHDEHHGIRVASAESSFVDVHLIERLQDVVAQKTDHCQGGLSQG